MRINGDSKLAELGEIKEKEKTDKDSIFVGETKLERHSKKIVTTTIENLSTKILKSHSEGNRFIKNDDL